MISQQMLRSASLHMEACGTPLAMKLHSYIAEGSWLNLVQTKVSPEHYSDPQRYFLDVSAADFFRKMPGLPTGIDLEKKAIETFWACEKDCYKTNQRMNRWINWVESGFFSESTADAVFFESLLSIRKDIRAILGKLPETICPKFGPGSTFHDRGSSITIPHKISASPAYTPQATWMDSFIFESAWGRSLLKDRKPSRFKVVSGNRFTSVPKDSTKNRGICIEPSGNLSGQLAIAAHIKKRLRLKTGVDLEEADRKSVV